MKNYAAVMQAIELHLREDTFVPFVKTGIVLVGCSAKQNKSQKKLPQDVTMTVAFPSVSNAGLEKSTKKARGTKAALEKITQTLITNQ